MKLMRIFIFLILLFPTHFVYAASNTGTVISLIEVRNDSGGSVIFVFRVDGKISKANLNNGYVQVQGGDDYGLHCNQVDEITIQCTTTKKTGGKNVVVYIGGSKFWTHVPEASDFQQCYNIYDWDSATIPTSWVLYGTICKYHPAQEGEEINWVNPSLPPPYIYIYSSASQPSWCSWSGLGSGYYYYYCVD